MEPSKDSPQRLSTPLPDNNLKSSLNQDNGPEMEDAEFVVKKEVCEGMKGILSTGKHDMSPNCEKQINGSSTMECFTLPATPIFKALAEEIPSPKFSESEISFLRKTLGVESPSINETVDDSPPL